MAPAQQQALTDKDLESIKSDLADAVTMLPPDAGPGLAPALGVNFRVNVIKALQATLQLARLVGKVATAGNNPAAWPDIGLEALAAVRAVFASLVQTMREIDYVTYVLLSEQAGGLTEADLKTRVEAFLLEPASQPFAWYLAMTEKRIESASQQVLQPNWMETTLRELEERGMAERKNGLVTYRPRNFVVGWKVE